MITIPLHTDPPSWMQAAVSFLLPPAYREPVLGDLQERFRERGARARWLGYVGDVVTTVPQVLRSQMRRIVTRGSLCAAAVPVACGAVRNTPDAGLDPQCRHACQRPVGHRELPAQCQGRVAVPRVGESCDDDWLDWRHLAVVRNARPIHIGSYLVVWG